jgi:hypothetical protein
MTDLDPFRLYDPASVGPDGYPPEWHHIGHPMLPVRRGVKDLVREQAGHRCERCGHPYVVGQTSPEWSPCDERCTHDGPVRCGAYGFLPMDAATLGRHGEACDAPHEARWRVLTVHHLNGVKWDLRWWNLAALCQRDHLLIQSRVVMERPWPWPHSDWFRPHAAGFYAAHFLGEDLTREETMGRLDELLEVGQRSSAEERMPL